MLQNLFLFKIMDGQLIEDIKGNHSLYIKFLIENSNIR